MTMSWPKGEIDHINRDRGDNRFINLRDISHMENANNRGTWGAVKLRGVRLSREGNRYVAQIMHRGKCLHLGSFKEATHAHSAFLIAESALR
jgi:hypothetical protein